MSLQFFTSYANLDEMINIRLLAHQIELGTAGTALQWLLDPTVTYALMCHTCNHGQICAHAVILRESLWCL